MSLPCDCGQQRFYLLGDNTIQCIACRRLVRARWVGLKGLHSKVCLVCGVSFESKRIDAKTCSDVCRQKKSKRS